jgi:hypothetical protein
VPTTVVTDAADAELMQSGKKQNAASFTAVVKRLVSDRIESAATSSPWW